MMELLISKSIIAIVVVFVSWAIVNGLANYIDKQKDQNTAWLQVILPAIVFIVNMLIVFGMLGMV